MSDYNSTLIGDVPYEMKSAVLKKTFNIELEDRNVPQVKDDEVLIQVVAVGVCGSDVHYYEHGRVGSFVVDNPLVLGHECSGIVVEKGQNVKNFELGDKVAVEPGVACGRCMYCKEGRYNLCSEVSFLATPPVDGAFSQYIKHRSDFVFTYPTDLSFELAVLNEPLSVGIHAARRARLSPGMTVFITGMGPVGLLLIIAAQAYGVSDIIVSDFSEKRLKTAEKLGASRTINLNNENVKEIIDEFTDRKGVDASFETAGHPDALESALSSVTKGGTIGIVGLSPEDNSLVNTPNIVSKELDILGIFRYANTYELGIKLLMNSPEKFDHLITDKFSLQDTQTALEVARTDKSHNIKVIVYPNE